MYDQETKGGIQRGTGEAREDCGDGYPLAMIRKQEIALPETRPGEAATAPPGFRHRTKSGAIFSARRTAPGFPVSV